MVNTIFADISFEDFRETYSQNPNGFDPYNREPFHRMEDVYLNNHERDYSNVFGKLPGKGGLYVGIVGSTDSALGQISELKPDLSLLLDINPRSLDYFNFRGALLEVCPDGQEYWRKIGSLFAKKYLVAPEDIPEEVNVRLPRRILKRLPHILNKGMLDDAFISKIKDPTEKLISFLSEDFSNGGWSSSNRYQAIKSAWENGLIKCALRDISNGGLELAYKLSVENGLPIKAVYLSNVAMFLSDQQRCNLHQNIAEGLCKGYFDRDCRMIDFEGFSTRVSTPEDYLAELSGELRVL